MDLALHQGNELVLLKDIAQRQDIPLAYLKHLVSPLIAGGVIRSSLGIRGGVLLARAPSQIKLNEVIQFLEGPIAAVECVNHPETCNRSHFCAARDVWAEVGEAMGGVLESINLQDLADRQKVKEPSKADMYYIKKAPVLPEVLVRTDRGRKGIIFQISERQGR